MSRIKSFLNERIDELLSKIDQNDKTTSQICAFMYPLITRCNWNSVKSVSFRWERFEVSDDHHSIIKPRIYIEFK